MGGSVDDDTIGIVDLGQVGAGVAGLAALFTSRARAPRPWRDFVRLVALCAVRFLGWVLCASLSFDGGVEELREFMPTRRRSSVLSSRRRWLAASRAAMRSS